MSVDMFVKFEPVLEGESQDTKHPGEIDVLSWSWGVTQSGSFHTGGGGGTGKCSVQDLNFTKYVDKATPNLWGKSFTGKHYDKATLTCRKAGGQDALEYLKITMEKVIISSVQTGAGQGDERHTENIGLNFAAVEIAYKEQAGAGGAAATPKIKYDIAANKLA